MNRLPYVLAHQRRIHIGRMATIMTLTHALVISVGEEKTTCFKFSRQKRPN